MHKKLKKGRKSKRIDAKLRKKANEVNVTDVEVNVLVVVILFTELLIISTFLGMSAVGEV